MREIPCNINEACSYYFSFLTPSKSGTSLLIHSLQEIVHLLKLMIPDEMFPTFFSVTFAADSLTDSTCLSEGCIQFFLGCSLPKCARIRRAFLEMCQLAEKIIRIRC